MDTMAMADPTRARAFDPQATEAALEHTAVELDA